MTLPEPVHLYDVRDKRYLGHAAQIHAKLSPGDGRFYALLPSKITGLETGVHPPRLAPGRTITWTATVQTTGQTTAGPHVMRCRILEPDGKPKRVHTVNAIAANGMARSQVRLALNAEHGTWHVEVTDVISGWQSRQPFAIE